MRTSLLLAVLAAPGAAAAASCGPHEAVVTRLAEGWGESRQAIGLGADNAVVEVFASPETGTWTITVTQPGGPTCMVASGDAWDAVAEALPADEQGA